MLLVRGRLALARLGTVSARSNETTPARRSETLKRLVIRSAVTRLRSCWTLGNPLFPLVQRGLESLGADLVSRSRTSCSVCRGSSRRGFMGSRHMEAIREQTTTKSGVIPRKGLLYEIFHVQSIYSPDSTVTLALFDRFCHGFLRNDRGKIHKDYRLTGIKL